MLGTCVTGNYFCFIVQTCPLLIYHLRRMMVKILKPCPYSFTSCTQSTMYNIILQDRHWEAALYAFHYSELHSICTRSMSGFVACNYYISTCSEKKGKPHQILTKRDDWWNVSLIIKSLTFWQAIIKSLIFYPIKMHRRGIIYLFKNI